MSDAADDIAISVEHLSKTYKVYPKPADLLREIFTRRVQHDLYHALTDIDFKVKRGECVGIIGPNGAGKSTLLKVIAGTLSPTSGDVTVRGRVSAILELGTGFHPEYSGRDNVFLGGMCLGMSRKDMVRKFAWIVDFSELGEVIDKPFKTYSSGMQARLTFATAISIEPEILIIDEALAAGDSYFVVKCGQRIREICDSGATVLFVSHSTHQVATLCDRAVWIEGGKMRGIGDSIDVCRRYDYSVHERISGGSGRMISLADTVIDSGKAALSAPEAAPPDLAAQRERPHGASAPTETMPIRQHRPSLPAASSVVGLEVLHDEVFRKGPARITKVEFLTAHGRPADGVRTWDPLALRVHYGCDDAAAFEGTMGLAIGIHRRTDKILVAQFSTVNPPSDEETRGYDHADFRSPPGASGVIEARFAHFQLLNGDYLLSLGILPNNPGTVEFNEYHHQRYLLRVLRNGYPSGAVFYPEVEWRHEAEGRAQSESPKRKLQ